MHQPPYDPNQRPSPYNQPTYPGQYPPPISPGQFRQQPPFMPPNNHTRPYSTTILIVFILVYIAFWAFAFIGGALPTNPVAVFVGDVGISLLFGLLASVLILDWSGFKTLDGWVKWPQIQRGKRIALVCVFFFFCMFVLGIYLIRKVLSYARQSQSLLAGQGWTPSTSTRPKIGLIVGIGVAIFALLLSSVSAYSKPNSALTSTNKSVSTTSLAPAQSPTHAALVVQATATLTAKPRPSPTPTLHPTPRPTSLPAKATPTPIPPKPTPCPGINCNPWSYNFNPGKLIYYPPSGFCNYFSCIPSFNEQDDPGDGYIVECSDGQYSQSGGERGACSYHGGVLRPLYSH